MSEETPIYDFNKFKAALERLGYTIGEAKPYTPLEVADVNLSNIQSGEVEITDEGIFYVNPNTSNKQQIFLYMRNYNMADWGKPKFHITNCITLQKLGTKRYRRANTGTVIVYDTSQERDVEVSGLPLCKNCLRIIRAARQLDYGSDMTSDEFEQILREAGEDTENDQEPDTDLEGYTWKWQKISEAYRTKRNYTCENCGFHPESRMDRQFIHVHHKDGRKTNNRESNLQCLCIACHSNVNPTHQENFSKGANRVMLDSFKKKYPTVGKAKQQMSDNSPNNTINVLGKHLEPPQPIKRINLGQFNISNDNSKDDFPF